MRLYGGRRIKVSMQRMINGHTEMRDAVVFDVDTTNRYARVKIQGSDTYIKAWYPENWEKTPVYLKPGNAVRISHPGANKGRIEIIGHGFLLPTAAPGGTAAPTLATPGDTVLTGCTLSPSSPAGMSGVVAPGTYRIDGTVYSIATMVMDDATLVMDRSDLIMGMVGGNVTFAAAHATYFRYDAVVAGVDGLPHVVQGDNFSATGTVPSPPPAPADHVRLAWVLIYPGMTAVTAADINRLFTTPAAVELRATIVDADLDWSDTSTAIAVSIRDQYGRVLTRAAGDYAFIITFTHGNGVLTCGSASGDETSPIAFSSYGSNMATYTRDGVDPGDQSPVLLFEESVSGLSTAGSITLRDAAGAIMY